MIKLALTIFKIRAASGVNGFLYFLKRIPLVKRLFPDRLYGAGAAKNILTMIFSVLSNLFRFLTKIAYVAAMILLPASYFIHDGDMFVFKDTLMEVGHIFFWLSGAGMLLSESEILNATKEKYIAIRYMRVQPRDYMAATFPLQKGLFFLSFLPAILIMTFASGGNGGDGLRLWLLMIGFRVMGEAIQLWAMNHLDKGLFRNFYVSFGGIMLALIIAYLPPALGWNLNYIGFLIGVPGLILAIVMLGLSSWYIFIRYQNWHHAVISNLKQEYVATDKTKTAKAGFRDVEMKEEDLKVSEYQGKMLEKKKGYAYLQALFFARHRRLLFRPVMYRVTGIWVVTLIVIILEFMNIDGLSQLIRKLPTFLPMLVFIMYFLSVAGKASKAMFYNCDNSMLTFNFYRKPDVIIRNFNIRLRYVIGYNMPISLSICLAAMLITGLGGGALFSIEMSAFYLCVIVLSIFFSIHYLFLYYVMQPYSSDLTVKNPVYTVVNQVVYILCFVCYNIRSAGLIFTLLVTALTIVYSIVALVLVYRLSPKYFRVK